MIKKRKKGNVAIRTVIREGAYQVHNMPFPCDPACCVFVPHSRGGICPGSGHWEAGSSLSSTGLNGPETGLPFQNAVLALGWPADSSRLQDRMSSWVSEVASLIPCPHSHEAKRPGCLTWQGQESSRAWGWPQTWSASSCRARTLGFHGHGSRGKRTAGGTQGIAVMIWDRLVSELPACCPQCPGKSWMHRAEGTIGPSLQPCPSQAGKLRLCQLTHTFLRPQG